MIPSIPSIARGACALAGALLLAGCAGTPPLLRKAEDVMQAAAAKLRMRGESNIANAASVARELDCGAKGAVPAKLESSTVLPERPRAGREINHRLVFATCPLGGDDRAGTLTRRFTHAGRTLFEDSTPHTLKPGRWSVDVFVGIPAQAPPGPYRLEVKFARRGLHLESASDFIVQP
jgi:hypothetical protein